MTYPLISIIVPVYNVEQYLDESIESIVNQTYKNLEIILVDDGSTDNSPQICDDWSRKDNRIIVIHKENGGASAARNAALDISKGDYIGFVDSDDYIDETMFEEMVSTLSGVSSKIAYCSAYRVGISGDVKQLTNVTAKKELDSVGAVNAIFYGIADTAVWSKLFKKELFDDIRFPEGEVNEELPILIPLVLKSGGMVCLGKTLYYYREREGSVTNFSYSQEKNSDIVYKNLYRIKDQLVKYQLPCRKAFRFFAASFAFSRGIAMEKKFSVLSHKIKKDYLIYRKIMCENISTFLFSRYSSFKDKLLYVLVLTKLLRPLYKIFYKKHL